MSLQLATVYFPCDVRMPTYQLKTVAPLFEQSVQLSPDSELVNRSFVSLTKPLPNAH